MDGRIDQLVGVYNTYIYICINTSWPCDIIRSVGFSDGLLKINEGLTNDDNDDDDENDDNEETRWRARVKGMLREHL